MFSIPTKRRTASCISDSIPDVSAPATAMPSPILRDCLIESAAYRFANLAASSIPKPVDMDAARAAE